MSVGKRFCAVLKDAPNLYIAVAIGILASFIRIVFSVDLYRDAANVYCFMARALAENNFADAFHSGIPSLNVLLSRPLTLAGIAPEQAMTIISCLFYVLSIFFLYNLLKEFVAEKLACMGALFYACAPKLIQFSCTPLIDSGKIFFLIAALYFARRLIRENFSSYRLALWFGGMLGGLALARSEGIGIAGVLAGALGVCYLLNAYQQKKFPPYLPLLSGVFTFVLLIASRIFLMYLHSGMFVFDSRISKGVCRVAARFAGAGATVTEGVAKPLRVSWGHLVNQNFRGSYEVYFIFACIGLLLIVSAALWKEREKLFPDKKVPEFVKWDSFYLVFLAVILCNALFFKLSDIAAYRYFLLNIPLLMIFTIIGFGALWIWCEKFVPGKLLYIVTGCLLACQIFNGLSNAFDKSSRYQYETGHYIGRLLNAKENTGKVWFLDKASIEWYYSGMRRAVPVEDPKPPLETFNDFEYVLCPVKGNEIDVIVKRGDLREIPLPAYSKVRLFQKIR